MTAAKLEPENGTVLYGLVAFYLDTKKLDKAEQYARRLTEIYPDHPDARLLLQDIRAMKAAARRLPPAKDPGVFASGSEA